MFRKIAVAVVLVAGVPASAMTLTSTDIKDGGVIPDAQIYPRCGGQNISPQLSWSGAPHGTESFVLTMIDTDVKSAGWSHWILVGIPASATSLASGAGTVHKSEGSANTEVESPSTATLPVGTLGIVSNFGGVTYEGPCPPPGSGVHHYRLTIWAMPAPMFMIDPDAKAAEVEYSLGRAALDHATITGSVTAPAAKTPAQ